VTIALPGTIQPLHQAPVYARTNGYVRRWYADLGARVRAGQLLATIESPETDQQLLQARASLQQARASLALAKTTLERYRTLADDSAITHQELDERTTAFEAAGASVAQQEANVQRLAVQQGYQRVLAPFAGVITSRSVDVGALISAAGGSTTAAGASAPLFSLAQIDTIRIFVAVPQAEVTSVAVGQRAEVTLREYPGRIFAGVVARTAGALDPASRTLQAEIDVPNPDGALLPGMYAEVRLLMGRAAPPLTIPAGALVIGTGAPQVATIDAAGAVRFRPIQLGRDYGATVEVLSGIDEGATLVLNPSDELKDGVRVKAVGAK
jgi:RND family efflux transporter MFP subunit